MRGRFIGPAEFTIREPAIAGGKAAFENGKIK